jgi:hypothetical protein
VIIADEFPMQLMRCEAESSATSTLVVDFREQREGGAECLLPCK